MSQSHSDRKLTVPSIRQLSNALCDCPCIVNIKSRNRILSNLKEQYPSINLDHNNPHVLISRIILKLQNCKGALENFIELVENESERRSPERGYLRQILREIYQSPSNPLLRLEADSFVIFRLDARDKKYIIPLQFPKLEDGQLRQAMRSRDTWNIIITFCRRLYRDYMDAYKYIVSGQISLAKININEALRELLCK